MTLGCKVSCQNKSALTDTSRPGWATLYKVSGSSLSTSVSSCITGFLPFICMQDWPFFTVQHHVKKTMHKIPTYVYIFFRLKCTKKQVVIVEALYLDQEGLKQSKSYREKKWRESCTPFINSILGRIRQAESRQVMKNLILVGTIIMLVA